MGGSSSSSNTNLNTVLGNTTTKNPYVTSTTNNKGTQSNFIDGTAFATIYDSVNNNIGNLLNEYLNPSLNSATNQAQLANFQKNMNEQMNKTMENNIVNPLTKRNMVRSSQATDMYNYANKRAASETADFTNDLLANSQANTANVMNNLLNAYLQGYNVINNNQAQSLNTSNANASKNQTTNVKRQNGVIDWMNAANNWTQSNAKTISSFMGL